MGEKENKWVNQQIKLMEDDDSTIGFKIENLNFHFFSPKQLK